MIAYLNKLPRLHLYAGQLILLMLIVQSLLRLGFLFNFDNPSNPAPLSDVGWAFYLGLKYDLQFSLILCLPLLLLGWYETIHPVYSRAGRILWTGYALLTITVVLLIQASNFGYYAYLHQGIDATALRFLETPLISATMVWQTYPVITGGLLMLALVYAYYRILLLFNARIDNSIRLNIGWKSRTGIVIITFFVVLFGLFGKISWYPLRWSDAFFSNTHTFTAYLASNPAMYFYNTLKNTEETFDLEAARHYYPLAADYLGVDQPDPESLNYRRSVLFENDTGRQPPNIIIVMLESFASYKTGLSGNPLDPTPNFDEIARQGLFFNNFYVPHTGTARSVWTLITGLPDIEKNRTSTRNPLIVKQHTIINAFEDYKKYYFLGGSASWANIRGLLSANIENLEIFEEGSYESPRVDVWGISDLSLFEEADAVLKNAPQPFFSIIQTSGNHRPYTIPEYTRGFKELTEDELELKPEDYGFQHLLELNSFRFMDHCVGEFMKMAREAGYFDNTIFVFFGDHGITASTGKHTPMSENQLQVSSHRVPLVFYAPGLLPEPQQIEKVASQVDIMPTLASLSRTSYINTTLGRDLFDPAFDDSRYAYTIVHGSFRDIGLLTDGYFKKMKFNGEDQRLFRLNTDTPSRNLINDLPELDRQLTETTRALNTSIRYIRENNSEQLKLQ